jgi:hypothetical protein
LGYGGSKLLEEGSGQRFDEIEMKELVEALLQILRDAADIRESGGDKVDGRDVR